MHEIEVLKKIPSDEGIDPEQLVDLLQSSVITARGD